MTTGLDAGVPLPYHSELMFLDLHTHSVSSDDSRATVEQYVKWAGVLRRKGRRIDGFVLTEHRKFDFDADYSSLAADGDVIHVAAGLYPESIDYSGKAVTITHRHRRCCGH